jgi:hypothetical protein
MPSVFYGDVEQRIVAVDTASTPPSDRSLVTEATKLAAAARTAETSACTLLSEERFTKNRIFADAVYGELEQHVRDETCRLESVAPKKRRVIEQPSIATALKSAHELNRSLRDEKRILALLSCCSRALSFAVVEDELFRKLTKSKCGGTSMSRSLECVYGHVCRELEKRLPCAPAFSIQFDGWTTRSLASCPGLLFSFVDSDLLPCVVFMDLIELTRRHTAGLPVRSPRRSRRARLSRSSVRLRGRQCSQCHWRFEDADC